MRDFFTKLSILVDMLSDIFETWRDEIWAHDLDERYCCDGRECGCYGATYRDVYRPKQST